MEINKKLRETPALFRLRQLTKKQGVEIKSFSFSQVKNPGEIHGWHLKPPGRQRHTVAFFHGWGNDSIFPQMQLFLDLLKRDIEIFTFDLYGHGVYTSTIITDKNIGFFIGECTRHLRENNGLTSYHAVGYSLGGLLLLHYLSTTKNVDDISFDHHGKEMTLSYNDTLKLLDKHPKKSINEDKDSIRRPEITSDAVISKLISKLKKPAETGIKSSEETIELKDLLEIYVPIFEARLIGPKKRIKILRIDAIRKKIL